MERLSKVFALCVLLCPCVAHSDCAETDETSLIQVKRSLKHGSERLEREQNESANVSANWTDYLSPLPPPIGALADGTQQEDVAESSAVAAAPPNASAVNVSGVKWTDYAFPWTEPLPPPIGHALLEEAADAAAKNDSATNWTERWTNYLHPYDRESWPPLKPEEVVPSGHGLIQTDSKPINESAVNVTGVRWQDYGYPLTAPMPPPIGHPSLAEVEVTKNDSATNWTERWTNYLHPYDRESWPPLKPEEVVPSGHGLIQTDSKPINESAVNVTGVRWQDYGYPLTAPMPPPIGHPSLAEVEVTKNDSATNWTERWTNYLHPYDRESWPPLKPEEVVPSGHGLIQTDSKPINESAVNVTGVRWQDYGYPLTAPMPPPIGHPSLAEVEVTKNDSATNWTERWTNYLHPYDRESWPPLKPEEVVPSGH